MPNAAACLSRVHAAWPTLGFALLSIPAVVYAQGAAATDAITLTAATSMSHAAEPSLDASQAVDPRWREALAQAASNTTTPDAAADDAWDGVMTPRTQPLATTNILALGPLELRFPAILALGLDPAARSAETVTDLAMTDEGAVSTRPTGLDSSSNAQTWSKLRSDAMLADSMLADSMPADSMPADSMLADAHTIASTVNGCIVAPLPGNAAGATRAVEMSADHSADTAIGHDDDAQGEDQRVSSYAPVALTTLADTAPPGSPLPPAPGKPFSPSAQEGPSSAAARRRPDVDGRSLHRQHKPHLLDWAAKAGPRMSVLRLVVNEATKDAWLAPSSLLPSSLPNPVLLADASDEPQHSLETASHAQAPLDSQPQISELPLRAYRYIPSATQQEDVPRPPQEQRLVELNLTGDYPRLARDGVALMKTQKVDDQLRFIIANALAWSGQLHAAEKLYVQLDAGPYALDAKVAMANILRWRGKDAQALPLYRDVLATMPNHTEALNAIALSEASMRPRTRISLQGARDSDDVMIRDLRVNHTWRTHEAKRVWDVGVHAMRDKSPLDKDLQSGLTVRHQRLDWRMQPAFELGIADSLYGSVSITPGKWPVTLSAGRVNWAQMAFNPRGLKKGLTAWNAGMRGGLDGRWGRLNVAADGYRVSDGNVVTTATARYQPGFRLPLGLRPLAGFEHRKSNFNTTDYWSPDKGYGLAYIGLEREISRGDRWQLNASVQRGWRVYGEAGKSWGAGLSGRVRIGKQWMLGANAWGVNNSRDGRPYRARSVTAFLERRW